MKIATNLTLETKRFIFSLPQIKDFSESAAMRADLKVARYTTGYSLTQEEAWARLLRNIGHWTALQYGHWIIRERATGKFVGEGGFSDCKRDIEPTFGDVPEASLALASWSHNKGFSYEILTAMLAWSDQHLPLKKTACIIYPENLSSLRIVKKCGFVEYAQATYKNKPMIIFTRSIL